MGGAVSSERGGQLGEIGDDEIRLMRRFAERPLAPVDERRPHAVGFRADAVEGVIGDKQDARPVLADDLRGLRVGLPMRLEIAGFLHRNDVVEREADVRPGGLQHVAIAVRQDREFVSLGPKLVERGDDVGKRLQLLDLADEPANLVLAIADAAAIHDVGDGAMSDLPVRRMPAIAKRIDHRILEVRAAPPSDEAIWLANPALLLQEGRDGRGEPALHVDDGPVLVECERLDFALQDARGFHWSPGPGEEWWRSIVTLADRPGRHPRRLRADDHRILAKSPCRPRPSVKRLAPDTPSSISASRPLYHSWINASRTPSP